MWWLFWPSLYYTLGLGPGCFARITRTPIVISLVRPVRLALGSCEFYFFARITERFLEATRPLTIKKKKARLNDRIPFGYFRYEKDYLKSRSPVPLSINPSADRVPLPFTAVKCVHLWDVHVFGRDRSRCARDLTRARIGTRKKK